MPAPIPPTTFAVSAAPAVTGPVPSGYSSASKAETILFSSLADIISGPPTRSIEYFNKAGHSNDRMRFGVSDGHDPPNFKEALSINTRHNPTTSTDYLPYIGISESNPTTKLYINHNDSGDILTIHNSAGGDQLKLTIGTYDNSGVYIDAPSGATYPDGVPLQLRAGGLTVATCTPTGVSNPNAFDLTSVYLCFNST